MSGAVLIAVLVCIGWLYVHGVRRKRRRWERRLALPGEWRCGHDGGKTRLRMVGRADAGTYVQTRRADGASAAAATDERGRWRLRGTSLFLQADGGAARQYDLRLFDDGTIGIDGPERAHWVLHRVSGGNVVPLRAVRN